MRTNIIRELLNEGKPTLSTRMITTSPQIVEIIGHSGAFDFIEFLGEYASWTLPDLENFSRAVELFPHMSSMMKVEREPRLHITQRALGIGFQSLLFADCDTAKEVIGDGLDRLAGQGGDRRQRHHDRPLPGVERHEVEDVRQRRELRWPDLQRGRN